MCASTDPFIGKCVAFGCNTTVGVELSSDFGKNWTSDAICYHLDQTAGHIVGSVMHKSRGIGSRTKDGGMKYDVAREFSSLGETSVDIRGLLERIFDKLGKNYIL